MSDFYPPLPDRAAWAVEIIARNASHDPYYLSESPYTSDEIEILQRISGQIALLDIEGDEEIPEETNKWGRLEKESNKLFKMLTDFSSKLNDKDNTETMAYFRTATSLLDKIVGIQERAANLKQLNLFHETVLSVMEDVLDPGQRTDAMNRLRASIKPEG